MGTAYIEKDILLLGNNNVLARNIAEDVGISLVVGRILDELVKPFMEVHIDDVEFACLKAIILLDPGLSLSMHQSSKCFRT